VAYKLCMRDAAAMSSAESVSTSSPETASSTSTAAAAADDDDDNDASGSGGVATTHSGADQKWSAVDLLVERKSTHNMRVYGLMM